MNRLLTVVIPTYNNTKGLQYLLGYFKDKNYQIIVVDNKPTEEKKKKIKELDSRRSLPSSFVGGENDPSTSSEQAIMYLPQERNLGFAGAINLGAKNVKTKWLLILNDDIEFNKVHKEGNRIEKLIEFAEKNKMKAVSPVLRNPDGKVENYGYRILPYGKVELNIENYSLGNNSSSIDGITAACLLIKTSVFKKLEGFDESFFAYLEDVDFFLCFKKVGYKMGIADAEVLHNHMITTKTMGNFKARQDMINWWRLFFKHPDKFKFNLAFIVERLRNVSGYLKATLKILK